MTYNHVIYPCEVFWGHLGPFRATSGPQLPLSQQARKRGQKCQFCHPENFFINIHDQTFIIIIIGPKMVFWPNLRPIGGYVFSEIGHLFIPIFGPFWHFLTIFGPFLAIKAKNILNWTLQVQKEPKKLEKLVQKLYCKLGSPKHPKIHPWAKNTPKIGVDG